MHWMSVKSADHLQIREHSWPRLFHIILPLVRLELTFSKNRCTTLYYRSLIMYLLPVLFRYNLITSLYRFTIVLLPPFIDLLLYL